MNAKSSARPPTKTADARTLAHDSPIQGKIFPPSGPVDVPNLPKAHVADNPDDASAVQTQAQSQSGRPHAPKDGARAGTGDDARPVAVDTTTENWADSTQPAPDKRTARPHNI